MINKTTVIKGNNNNSESVTESEVGLKLKNRENSKFSKKCSPSLLDARASCASASGRPCKVNSNVNTDIAVRNRNYHTATLNHVPYGITQCYLPPGSGDFVAFTPAEAGT